MIGPRLMLAAALTVGCASIGCGGPASLAKDLGDALSRAKHPHRAAVYLSPELDAGEMQIYDAGETTTLTMDGALRKRVIETAERMFAGIVLLDGPDVSHDAPWESVESVTRRENHSTLWPERKKAPAQKAPDVVFACYPVDMTARVVDGGSCTGCRDNFAVRIQLYFEVRDLSGTLLTTGKVEGRGTARDESPAGAPLAERFRAVLDEATLTASSQLQLALSSAEIDPNAPPADEERLAERDTDDAADS